MINHHKLFSLQRRTFQKCIKRKRKYDLPTEPTEPTNLPDVFIPDPIKKRAGRKSKEKLSNRETVIYD